MNTRGTLQQIPFQFLYTCSFLTLPPSDPCDVRLGARQEKPDSSLRGGGRSIDSFFCRPGETENPAFTRHLSAGARSWASF